jgi:hypothetical protein
MTIEAPPAVDTEVGQPIAILSRKTVPLSTSLTDEEQRDRGRQLARTIEDHRTEESRQEGMKREMKFVLAGLEAERDRLSAIVSRGEELRDVEVEERADYSIAEYVRQRMDTGEVLERRKLRENERQVPLEGVV